MNSSNNKGRNNSSRLRGFDDYPPPPQPYYLFIMNQ